MRKGVSHFDAEIMAIKFGFKSVGSMIFKCPLNIQNITIFTESRSAIEGLENKPYR